MEEKLNALCIKTIDYKDNDRLITLCTVEKGKILVKATGCKLPKAKLKNAASPLCFGEYIVIESRSRFTLKGCDIIDNFSPITLDIKRYYAGFSILEWLDKLTNQDDTETCRQLLFLAAAALKELSYTEDLAEKILIKFIYKSLNVLGYGLNFDTCSLNGTSLNGVRKCYDFYIGGMVTFSNRSMDYLEFSDDEIDIIKNYKDAEIGVMKNLLQSLEKILCYSTATKKNYSLNEFYKF